MVNLQIIWASMYGTAEGVANNLKALAEDSGISVSICEMDAFKVSELDTVDYLAVVTSTTGSGDVPANGEYFWSDLEISEVNLDKLKFGVCSLGDIAYENFCGAGKKINEQLIKLNAIELIKRAELDNGDEGHEAWCKSFIRTLN